MKVLIGKGKKKMKKEGKRGWRKRIWLKKRKDEGTCCKNKKKMKQERKSKWRKKIWWNEKRMKVIMIY